MEIYLKQTIGISRWRQTSSPCSYLVHAICAEREKVTCLGLPAGNGPKFFVTDLQQTASENIDRLL